MHGFQGDRRKSKARKGDAMHELLPCERPIVMAGESVRAILAGRKTQARRVIRPQPECSIPGAYFDAYAGGPEWCWWTEDNRQCNGHGVWKCPFGTPGDRLWVREAWNVDDIGEDTWMGGRENFGPFPKIPKSRPPCGWVRYRADYPFEEETDSWRSPMAIPRWASRLTLEVTGVRVEQLAEISEADAIAEGMPWMEDETSYRGWHAGEPAPNGYSFRNAFRHRWDRLNGKRPGCAWADNPWVWVIEFRRIEP